MLRRESSRPDGNSSGAAVAGTPLGRTRPRIAALALLLGAIVAGLLVAGHMTSSPILLSLTLHATPWTTTLDEAAGRLIVANLSPGGAAISPSHGFASAGSYSFAVNGNHGNIYNLPAAQGPNTLSLLGENGSLARTVPVAGEPGAIAVDSRHGLLYITSEDEDTLNVYDARTAALLHTITVGTRPSALAVSATTGRLFVVNGADGTVSMLDAGNNGVLRTVNVPTAVDGATAAVDSEIARVFIATAGSLSILDARSGALLKTISLESGGALQSASPAQSGSSLPGATTGIAVDERAGRVYILSSGVLSIVEAGTGTVLQRIAVGSDATALAVDARAGRLFLTHSGKAGTRDASGSLEVLDPRTGAVHRTVSIGVAPIAVAVDERAGRVLVVNSGGGQSAVDPLGWLPSGIRLRLPFVSRGLSGARSEPGSVTVLSLARLEE